MTVQSSGTLCCLDLDASTARLWSGNPQSDLNSSSKGFNDCLLYAALDSLGLDGVVVVNRYCQSCCRTAVDKAVLTADLKE